MDNIINETLAFAQKEYEKNNKWNHIKQVMEIADYLSKFYVSVDIEILKLAVILHDVSYNSYETHVEDSMKVANNFLEKIWYPRGRILQVLSVMQDHSWPHRKRNGEAKTIEWKIIYDADKFYSALTQDGYEKYFDQFYLKETKDLIQSKIK